MNKYVLVIDEGTTGTRALIFNQKFAVVGQAYEEFTQFTPSENMVEHDAEEIYQKSITMCNRALESAKLSASDIECIGITNQRNTGLVWNKTTGKPLYHALVWQDSRMGEASNAIKASSFFNELLAVSGKNITPHCDVLILKWLLEHVEGIQEELDRNNVLFGTIDTWLVWKLTEGRTHATSFSNASSSGCMDVKAGKWYKALFDRVGVPMALFPEIKSESADYGYTEVLGSRIPITGVIADQQSALFAQGCLDPGSVKCTNGTGSFMDINIGSTYTVPSGGVDTLIAWNLGGKNTYAVEGFAAVTGSAVQWLRDGLKIIHCSAEVESLASSVPDTNGVYFVPGLIGLITPYQDPFARGLLIGITRGTTEAHIARATLEAIAFRIKDILNIVEDNGIRISEIKIDGGASENNLLAQIIADYCDATVIRPHSVEATSLGAALMASLYLGHTNLDEVKDMMSADATFSPRMDAQQRDETYGIWQEAVGRSLNWLKH
ncbi:MULTISPECIES: FGGY family carbohydrate kinase [Clostridia]|uniref:FGGY family carbohydrate kinase n=1 Tax=Clostridia TaxID=186801 RepID=UPI0023F59040|nr:MULTISPECIES: glycerol kinase [Clostridia]MDD4692020.1 glycerol kinase GlpK [Eubacterium aggregans]MEA5004694.1 glycerol kinase [Christensenella sp.]